MKKIFTLSSLFLTSILFAQTESAFEKIKRMKQEQENSRQILKDAMANFALEASKLREQREEHKEATSNLIEVTSNLIEEHKEVIATLNATKLTQ
ncbi:MAG: hypothetical protein I8H75_02085 [Myxococcaceae bacterium]|nr:hypothetical protein [Myxococcaceae bacterium]MBH2006125.1 hypothetical protein [Myxococcaceae bacterium]